MNSPLIARKTDTRYAHKKGGGQLRPNMIIGYKLVRDTKREHRNPRYTNT